MSFLRDNRTTTVDQTALWRKWVHKEKKLQATAGERWRDEAAWGSEWGASQRSSRPPSKPRGLTPLEEIRQHAKDVRKRKDPWILGHSQQPPASPTSPGRPSTRGSSSVRDVGGYRRLHGVEASGGLHMYQRASMHETLHHLPLSSTHHDSAESRGTESLRNLTPESEGGGGSFFLNETSNSSAGSRVPKRILRVPRSSSPDPSAGLSVVAGSTQLGFRSAGRLASLEPLRPPSPPRGETGRFVTAGSHVRASAQGDTWGSQYLGSQEVSWQDSLNSIKWNNRPTTERSTSVLGINEEFTETLSRGKSYAVTWQGTPVNINAKSVIRGRRKTTTPNWMRVATAGPVVDLCLGEEHILRERLNAMQEAEAYR